MFYETTITPSAGGFGEYDQNTPNGDGWEFAYDLVSEMRGNEPELAEIGIDDLPEGCEDIRGRIHNQAGRIFALPPADVSDSAHYFAVVEL
jgi:hypothetical protein